mgnify:CR=1 FL=1
MKYDNVVNVYLMIGNKHWEHGDHINSIHINIVNQICKFIENGNMRVYYNNQLHLSTHT